MALGGKAVGVGERAEVAVAAGDRIADELDQAVRPGGRIHQRAVAGGQADEARVALRPLRLPVELDGVRARRQPRREHAYALPRRRNGACGVPSTTALKICADPATASSAASDVPEKRATNPLPDQEKRGWAGIEVRVDAAEPAHPRRDDARGRLHRVRIDRRRARIHRREARIHLVAVWIGGAAGGGDRRDGTDHSWPALEGEGVGRSCSCVASSCLRRQCEQRQFPGNLRVLDARLRRFCALIDELQVAFGSIPSFRSYLLRAARRG